MKKFIIAIFALLLLIVIGAYVILFTGFGNSIVQPYAEKFIKDKSGFDVKFSKFEIHPTSVDMQAAINNEIKASANGTLSVFSQSLDLKYDIAVENLSSFGVNLKEKMLFAGMAKGKFNDFIASGAGKLLGSNVKFDANLKNYKPLTLNLNAKAIELDKALTLATMPPYASGKVDIIANIKESAGAPNGKANVTLSDIFTNNALIERDFNVTLPANFKAQGMITADIKDWLINAKSAIVTPIAVAGSEKSIYDINSKTLSSDFRLIIEDMSKLEPIIKQNIGGKLNAAGNVILTANELKNLDADIQGFGGNVKAALNGGKLTANLSSIKLAELLKVVGQPAYASASIDGTATLENLNDKQNIKGGIKLATKEGKLNASELKKGVNLNLAKDLNFALNADVSVEKSLAKFSSALTSELLNLNGVIGEYDIAKGTLVSKFKLIANDLAKFESLLGQKLSGAVNLSGEVKAHNAKILELTADGNVLGGEINAMMKGENLRLNLKNGALKDAFLLAGLDPLANGTLNLTAALSPLDPKNLNGDVKITLENGQIYEKAASKIAGKQLPAGLKFSANSSVKLDKSVANFDAVANVSGNDAKDMINLKSLKGAFDINKNSLNSTFEVGIPDLRRIAFLTGRQLNGAMNLNGDAQKQGENLTANIISKIANGDMKADLRNDKLTATLANFTVKGLTDLLIIDHVYDGVGDAKLNYDLSTQKGAFNVTVDEGKLVKSNFTQTFQSLTGRDITTEIYKNSKINGTINKSLINFNADMNASRSHIDIANGVMDTATKAINIPVRMNYEKTDIAIDITGTTNSPKYNVSSDYLKNKAMKEIDRFLNKKLGKDENGTKNSTKDAVRGLLKELF